MKQNTPSKGQCFAYIIAHLRVPRNPASQERPLDRQELHPSAGNFRPDDPEAAVRLADLFQRLPEIRHDLIVRAVLQALPRFSGTRPLILHRQISQRNISIRLPARINTPTTTASIMP